MFSRNLVRIRIAAIVHDELILNSLNRGAYPYSFYGVYIDFPTLPLSSVLIADLSAVIFILAISGLLQKIVSGCLNFLKRIKKKKEIDFYDEVEAGEIELPSGKSLST